MRSRNSPSGPSFLQAARRAQIVGCAIDVLAEEGYAMATLARIAARAGVSKSVVVYHFGGKDQVFEQAVVEIMKTATEVVRPQVEAEPTATGRLRACLRARVGFLKTHRHHMLALFEIWRNLRDDEGRLRLGEADAVPTVDAIERILRDGQDSGGVRDVRHRRDGDGDPPGGRRGAAAAPVPPRPGHRPRRHGPPGRPAPDRRDRRRRRSQGGPGRGPRPGAGDPRRGRPDDPSRGRPGDRPRPFPAPGW